MFYLLKDNRIIDSEKYINSILNKGENSENNYEYLYEIRNGQSYYYGKIKKQSENVYDLIDWENDIVRIDCLVRKNYIYDCKINKSYFLDGYYNSDWITAIYKLDEKGNYIKVWEKKEDE